MSVFLYKKAIKIESNFVKEETEEEQNGDEKKTTENEHAHLNISRESKLTISRVGKRCLCDWLCAAHLFINFDELL